MLVYHMNALHQDLNIYSCPHCGDVTVPLEDVRYSHY